MARRSRQGWGGLLGAVGSLVVMAVAADQPLSAAYLLGGKQAPQVAPNPVAQQLQQQVDALRQRWKRRTRVATLQQAIEGSLLANPLLAQAYNQIQERQWTLIAVRRQWYPQLSASSTNLPGYQATTRRLLTSNTSAPLPVYSYSYSNSSQVNPALQLSWTFFDPSRGPSINAASESLRSQRLLFDVTARQLVLDTQLAYFNLQEQLLLIDAYEEILNSTTRAVIRTEALFNQGSAAISDVEQIRTQQYQNLSLLIATYQQLVQASAVLAQQMALPEGELVIPADELAVAGEWTLSQAETLSQAQRLREEIQASLAQSASAGWSATALFNRYWPRFALGASGSFDTLNTVTGEPGSAFSVNTQDNRWNGSVALGFSWSIFDGGIDAATAEARRASASQLSHQAALQRLQVSREVETAYAAYQASQLGLQSSSQLADSARNAAKAVQERFNIGFADMTSVVQTLDQAIQAANAYASAIRAYNGSVAGLYRFSAQWPDGTQPLLQTRVQGLKPLGN